MLAVACRKHTAAYCSLLAAKHAAQVELDAAMRSGLFAAVFVGLQAHTVAAVQQQYVSCTHHFAVLQGQPRATLP
jgi:hypothetical protein